MKAKVKHITQKELAAAGKEKELKAVVAELEKDCGWRMKMHLAYLEGLREGMAAWKRRRMRELEKARKSGWQPRRVALLERHIEKSKELLRSRMNESRERWRLQPNDRKRRPQQGAN